jgi:hypothetical protein
MYQKDNPTNTTILTDNSLARQKKSLKSFNQFEEKSVIGICLCRLLTWLETELHACNDVNLRLAVFYYIIFPAIIFCGISPRTNLRQSRDVRSGKNIIHSEC